MRESQDTHTHVVHKHGNLTKHIGEGQVQLHEKYYCKIYTTFQSSFFNSSFDFTKDRGGSSFTAITVSILVLVIFYRMTTIKRIMITTSFSSITSSHATSQRMGLEQGP